MGGIVGVGADGPCHEVSSEKGVEVRFTIHIEAGEKFLTNRHNFENERART